MALPLKLLDTILSDDEDDEDFTLDELPELPELDDEDTRLFLRETTHSITPEEISDLLRDRNDDKPVPILDMHFGEEEEDDWTMQDEDIDVVMEEDIDLDDMVSETVPTEELLFLLEDWKQGSAPTQTSQLHLPSKPVETNESQAPFFRTRLNTSQRNRFRSIVDDFISLENFAKEGDEIVVSDFESIASSKHEISSKVERLKRLKEDMSGLANSTKFIPAEDDLLVLGLLKHGQHVHCFSEIQKEYFPAKTESELRNRMNNRWKQGKMRGNCLRLFKFLRPKKVRTGLPSENEIRLLLLSHCHHMRSLSEMTNYVRKQAVLSLNTRPLRIWRNRSPENIGILRKLLEEHIYLNDIEIKSERQVSRLVLTISNILHDHFMTSTAKLTQISAEETEFTKIHMFDTDNKILSLF